MAKQKAAADFSLRREDATSGGGIDGAIATMSIGFVQDFTYGGRHKEKPQTAVRVEYTIDGFDKPWEDHHTLGPSDRYEVSSDGYAVKSSGKSGGLNKGSGAYFFFDAIQEALEAQGLDIDEYLPATEDGASVEPLDGIQVRLGNKKFTPVSGDPKDKAVPVEFILDSKSSKKTANGNGKAKGGAFDIEELTEAAVVALLADSGKPIKKTSLSNDIYAANRKDPNAKKMMELTFKDSWVYSEDRPWDFDRKKGVISAREEE